VFTFEEVARHFLPGDCWTVIRGEVFDLTRFVDLHPGGSIILEAAGKDGTRLFTEEFPHSETGEAQLRHFRIGRLG